MVGYDGADEGRELMSWTDQMYEGLVRLRRGETVAPRYKRDYPLLRRIFRALDYLRRRKRRG